MTFVQRLLQKHKNKHNNMLILFLLYLIIQRNTAYLIAELHDISYVVLEHSFDPQGKIRNNTIYPYIHLSCLNPSEIYIHQ